jgi:hypothetical protein
MTDRSHSSAHLSESFTRLLLASSGRRPDVALDEFREVDRLTVAVLEYPPAHRIHSLAIRKPDIRYFPVPHPEPSQAEISGSSTRAVYQLFVACIWQRVPFLVTFNEFFVDFRIQFFFSCWLSVRV